MQSKISPKKRRKAVRKEESIRLRCTVEQKNLLTDAAMAAGLGLSSWLLMIGLREAKQQKGEPSR